MKLLLTFLVILNLLASGCSTPETTAYRALGTTAHVVDGAMNGWGDYVRAGKASPENERTVRAAYERYQAAMRVANLAVVSYRTSGDKPALDRALDAMDSARIALIGIIHLYATP